MDGSRRRYDGRHILLPPETSGFGYGRRHTEFIEAEIRKSTPRGVETFRWPPVLDSAFERKLRILDWILVDVGQVSAASGIIGYLHGRFIPMMRLLQVSPDASREARCNLQTETLFSAYEVGYSKDIIRWSDEATLQTELAGRLAILNVPETRMRTLA